MEYGSYVYNKDNFIQEYIFLKRQLVSFCEALGYVRGVTFFMQHRQKIKGGSLRCSCLWKPYQRRLASISLVNKLRLSSPLNISLLLLTLSVYFISADKMNSEGTMQ